jgi:hypothetical protein
MSLFLPLSQRGIDKRRARRNGKVEETRPNISMTI